VCDYHVTNPFQICYPIVICTKHKISLTVHIKLNLILYAKNHGNRAAKRRVGSLPTENMIHEWMKQEERLQKLDKNKHF
jgi:hypothetical protein